jgi:uncharacterized Zn finger protein
LQREAPINHRYDKLVSALLTAGRKQEAHDWIIVGFAKTIDKLPGIAWRLAEQLMDMAKLEKEHANIASVLALKFFYRPDTALYRELEKAAKRIRCWPAARQALLTYLETGVRPDLQPIKNTRPAPPPPTGRFLPVTCNCPILKGQPIFSPTPMFSPMSPFTKNGRMMC